MRRPVSDDYYDAHFFFRTFCSWTTWHDGEQFAVTGSSSVLSTSRDTTRACPSSKQCSKTAKQIWLDQNLPSPVSEFYDLLYLVIGFFRCPFLSLYYCPLFLASFGICIDVSFKFKMPRERKSSQTKTRNSKRNGSNEAAPAPGKMFSLFDVFRCILDSLLDFSLF